MGLDAELSGILVVSLEQAVAAPYCGLLMANAGARVIKVERPEGDFARGYDSGADGQSATLSPCSGRTHHLRPQQRQRQLKQSHLPARRD